MSTHTPEATPDDPLATAASLHRTGLICRQPTPSSRMLLVPRLTRGEVDALMVAVARSLDPHTTVTDAWEAAAVIWKHGGEAGPILTSLATMFAELRGPS